MTSGIGLLKRYIAVFLVLGLAVLLVPVAAAVVVQVGYGGAVVEWGDAPAAPVALVFGAGIRPDGRLSPMLADRMDTAIALYEAGKVRQLLVSGDNRFVDYDEPGRMYDYAVAHGVPAEDVVRDYAGRRTYDTCYRAHAIFGVESALLVTQRFHLPRALYTCENLGVVSVGVSADRYAYRSNAYYRLRDTVATVRAWLDVRILHPLPVLGEPIDMGL